MAIDINAVDLNMRTMVKKTGDTMTGNLIVNADVGIGAPSPGTSLGALGGTAAFEIMSGSSAGTAVLISLGQAGTTDTYNLGIINFGSTGCAAADKRAAMIQCYADGSQATNPKGKLAFWTANGGTITQKVTIDGAGNVGIGQVPTSTVALLEVLLAGVPAAANNAAAATAGVAVGGFYRTNADPSVLCIRSA